MSKKAAALAHNHYQVCLDFFQGFSSSTKSAASGSSRLVTVLRSVDHSLPFSGGLKANHVSLCIPSFTPFSLGEAEVSR